MRTDKDIQILLSTFNGAKYICEQLDSIISQDCFSNIKILIRDDGSADETVDILREYSERYENIEVFFGENIGVNKSYFTLLQWADKSCKYFSFSDQDDIWLPQKMSLALSHLSANDDGSVPYLYASRSEIVTADLEHIGEVLAPKRSPDFFNAVIQNVMPGHTQVFNKKALELILSYGVHEEISVIDWWVYLTVSAKGKTFFDDTITVRHRQHQNNTIGYETNFLKQFFFRVKRAFGKDKNASSKQVHCLFEHCGSDFSDEYRQELEYYFSSMRSVVCRSKYIVHTKLYRQTALETIIFKILYLLGKYNI